MPIVFSQIAKLSNVSTGVVEQVRIIRQTPQFYQVQVLTAPRHPEVHMRLKSEWELLEEMSYPNPVTPFGQPF